MHLRDRNTYDLSSYPPQDHTNTYHDHGEHDDNRGQYGELGAAETNDVVEESTNDMLAEEITQE